MTHSSHEEVPVLILGGGVVGLSAALLLLHHGVRPLLIERHPGASVQPRSRGIHARSGEIFRQLGLFDAIKSAGAALQPTFGIYAGETFAAAIEPVPRRAPEAPERQLGVGVGQEALTPTPAARCTQDVLEPLLRVHAVERGADLRFSTLLESFAQDDDGVTATLVDRQSGERRAVRAQYMIAADGVKGSTREQLGIATRGAGTLGHLLNVLLQVDLGELVRGREPSQVLTDDGAVRGLWLALDSRTRWAFHLVYQPERGGDYPAARCAELARQALGLPAAAIEVLAVSPWQPAVRVAERFRAGRVLLAGDAAHQMPPWAGQGANSGIADVHNLAWKLAAVLRGAAAPSLLDSYDLERRPVGRHAAEGSGAAAGRDGLPRISDDGTPAAGQTLGLHFIAGVNYVYDRPGELSLIDSFDARIGSRVPHAWVERAGRRMSTLDLFGRSFVLLGHGDAWRDAARAVSEQRATVVSTVAVDTLRDAESWIEQIGLRAGGAILVRPDGFVAWRSDGVEATARLRAVDQALAASLGTRGCSA